SAVDSLTSAKRMVTSFLSSGMFIPPFKAPRTLHLKGEVLVPPTVYPIVQQVQGFCGTFSFQMRKRESGVIPWTPRQKSKNLQPPPSKYFCGLPAIAESDRELYCTEWS